MRIILLAIAMVIASVIAWAKWQPAGQRNDREIIVGLDGWWNVDYAKGICRPRANEPDCVGDPTAEVRDFEDRLITHLAAHPLCKGVQVARFEGPNAINKVVADAMQKTHWMLFLDYVPSNRKQQWQMSRDSDFMKGEGDPKEIASFVCPIVTDRGAHTQRDS
jgi:hypothetical protein